VAAKRIATGAPSVEEVSRLLKCAAAWGAAVMPANPIATERKLSVLKAITRCLVSLIAGRRWTALENQLAFGREVDVTSMQVGVGHVAHEKSIAAAIRRELNDWRLLAPNARAPRFASILKRYGGRFMTV
jgi:hypothetical protein